MSVWVLGWGFFPSFLGGIAGYRSYLPFVSISFFFFLFSFFTQKTVLVA